MSFDSAIKRLWRGELQLGQAFWGWWFVPILGFYFVLWLSWAPIFQHLGVAAIPIAMLLSVSMAVYASIGVIKSAKKSSQSRFNRYLLGSFSVLGTLVHCLAFCFAIFLAIAFYQVGLDSHDENREAERSAVPSAQFPLAGFWKTESSDNFGLAISPAEAGLYSVSFCGPGGCFKPGTYRPDTPIAGDENYSVVDENTIKVQVKDGWQIYRRAPARDAACISGN